MKKQKSVEQNKYGLIFLIPFFVTFLVFQLYPLIYTFYKSLDFTKRAGRYMTTTRSFGNFTEYVFGKEAGGEFWNAMIITLGLWICNFIPQILLSLLLAAWFTNITYKLKAQGVYKVIMYLPNIITAATISVLFRNFFVPNGSITKLLIDAKLVKPTGILDHGWFSFFIIAFIQFWMWYGNTMIVLCAGILGINPALYEAAMVDGANSRQQFFKITLPLLKPILQYTLVTSAIGGLQMYDIPALFNTGNTMDGNPIVKIGDKAVYSTTTVIMLIKKYVSEGPVQNVGKAAAYSVVLFIITLAVSMIFYMATRTKDKDGRA